MKIKIRKLRKLNQKAGYHFFDKKTIKFFDSNIETYPSNPYFLFITSERDKPRQKVRYYSIRRFDPKSYKVENISEFQQFGTIEKAKKALDRYKTNQYKASSETIRDLKASL